MNFRANIVRSPLAIAVALVFLTGLGWVLHLFSVNNRLNEGYRSVARGMTLDNVIRLMGNPTTTNNIPVPYWDWDPLPNWETNNMDYTVTYPVRSTMPMFYGISFSKAGLVVGKHSYD